MSGKSIDYWREAWNNVLEYFYEDEHAKSPRTFISFYTLVFLDIYHFLVSEI